MITRRFGLTEIQKNFEIVSLICEIKICTIS